MARKRPLAPCRFRSTAAKQKALRVFLTKHGDDLPKSAIAKATSPDALRRWTLRCDTIGIAAAMRYEPNDWYLCTVKNAAVRPDRRGEGHGSQLYLQTSKDALTARRPKQKGGGPACLVLAADVTRSNTPSIRALERAGFRRVSSFRWSRKRGDSADIMHYVRVSARVKDE